MNLSTLARILGLAALLTVSAAACAWPDKPVRIIVPAAPGSAPDVAMRLIGNKVSQLLKQPVVVDNRVGAGGVVAMQNFMASKDEHTFLFAISSTTAIAPLTLKAAAGYDYVRDLQPVVRLAQTPLMIVASPKSGLKTMDDVLKLARENPGAVAFATPGRSTLGNLAVEWISQTVGLRFNVVPFSRTSDSVTAIVSGDASVFIDGISVVLPLVRSNRLQPVAVLSSTKLPGLESYPLGRDTVGGLEVVGRFGLLTGKETPRAIVDAMGKAAVAALADPEVVVKLTDLGLYPLPGDAAAYLATLRQESAQWAKVVQAAGVLAE